MLLRFGIETAGYLFRLHRGLDIPERRVAEYGFLRNTLQIECFLFGQSGIISTCIGFLKKYATEYIGDKIRTLSGRVAVIVIVKRDAWISVRTRFQAMPTGSHQAFSCAVISK